MKIKNYNKFQHFKDRRPPWIKLHRELLDQRDISLLSDQSFRVLIGLWLLASEDESMQGNLPDIPEIAFRLRIPEADIFKSFQELKHFIVDLDDKMISVRYQVDEPETETETEIKKETKKNFVRKSDDQGFAEFWEMYPKKVGKDAAFRLWKKLDLSQEIKDQIQDALKWQRVCDQWKRDNGQFVPNPFTYLNQGRWQDEQPPPAKLEVYETPYQKSRRLRVEELSPGAARKINHPFNANFVEDVQNAIANKCD